MGENIKEKVQYKRYNINFNTGDKGLEQKTKPNVIAIGNEGKASKDQKKLAQGEVDNDKLETKRTYQEKLNPILKQLETLTDLGIIDDELKLKLLTAISSNLSENKKNFIQPWITVLEKALNSNTIQNFINEMNKYQSDLNTWGTMTKDFLEKLHMQQNAIGQFINNSITRIQEKNPIEDIQKASYKILQALEEQMQQLTSPNTASQDQ